MDLCGLLLQGGKSMKSVTRLEKDGAQMATAEHKGRGKLS
jgi:hypothetical protein